MHRQKLLSLARAVLSRPTAPFHEAEVAKEILLQLKKCPHVKVERDPFGNLIARYRRGRAKARYAFAAHMDHPGWVREAGDWKFLGSVPPEYLNDPKLVDFGGYAMWDLPACELRDGLLHSRACDDLLGCVTILAMFQDLEKSGAECSCAGLFTRAEEVGFVGAIKLAQSGLLPKSLTIISLETSSERSPAKIGAGPILRVGDRASIFDSAATAAFAKLARTEKIEIQRCLMSGGTCEATAYQLFGYRSAALCVALGNYHNCGPRGKIDAEFVSADDLAGLVKLCTAIARHSPKTGGTESSFRRRLEQNARTFRRRFNTIKQP